MRRLTAKLVSKLSFLLIVLVSSASVSMPTIFASNSEDAATTSIERAENVLVSAFQAVLEAEQVGADVSVLLAQLNEAEEFLAEARMALGLGEFDEAVHSANICSEIGETVTSEADELLVEVYGSRVMVSWLTMSGSLVGVFVVGFGSFWSWRVFKRRYHRRVLRTKPEVAKDES
jgi:hypothetical protein